VSGRPGHSGSAADGLGRAARAKWSLDIFGLFVLASSAEYYTWWSGGVGSTSAG